MPESQAVRTVVSTDPARADASASRSVVRRSCECGQRGGACACRDEEKSAGHGTLQRSARTSPGAPAGGYGPALPLVRAALASPSQPLDPDTRRELGSRLGCDFSPVRVHTSPTAAESARALHASAYTVGPDVVFGSGQYSPRSEAGRVLIAHELAHVAQQLRGAGSRSPDGELTVGAFDDPLERQADQVAAGLAIRPGAAAEGSRSGPGPVIRRSPAGRPAPAAPPARRPPIVDDGQPTVAGQMRKTEFLGKLYNQLIAACDAELKPFGRTAQDCPYIIRTIERYRGQPASALLRVVRAFAHPPETADAQALIAITTRQARVVARRLGARYPDGSRQPQAKAASPGSKVPAGDSAAVRRQLGTGRTLDADTRARMETSFGQNFASVRVHADPDAARASAELGARAFTVGHDIAFAAGQYRPGTQPGDLLIAHELAHTIQQGAGPAGRPGGPDDHQLESDADRAASAAVTLGHGAATPLRAGGGGLRVQRWPAVLAGALIVGEAAPEVAVVAEVGAVSTEVVVVDGTIVAAADVAAPAVVTEATLPAATEALSAPTALETTAASTSSAVSTTATVAAAAAATTLSSDTPAGEEEEEKKKRKCRPEPCEHPLPISWPAELPYPEGPRALLRVPSVEREWEGIDRAADQSRLAREIKEARDRNVPPPSPCFEWDAEPNAPYDAHHRHPLYLGGEEAPWNLCALRADRHQSGHVRLNDQTSHLAEYEECGICSGYLYQHPFGQAYVITGSK